VTTLHESADYTFRTICENGWANESTGDIEAPTGYFYSLSVLKADWDLFIDEFWDVDGFDKDLFMRTVRESPFFLVRKDAYGFWYVDQYPTFAERDAMFEHLEREYEKWSEM
jgi:hypothetical protein